MADTPNPLTAEELIRSELGGKFNAVERYDTILWKVRSGYLAILYGGLGLLAGKGLDLASVSERQQGVLLAVLLLVWGFSACAALVDLGFVRAKLRVVIDSDALSDLALELSLDQANLSDVSDLLRDLLHNSGESSKPVPRRRVVQAVGFLVPLYLATPLVVTAIYFMVI
ncbi:MAG TPA: hypothetical protein VHF25_05600 [Nitriliruptorales bacterium]|nr:hypothetical protein [Nitriliruptorales bacterium]